MKKEKGVWGHDRIVPTDDSVQCAKEPKEWPAIPDDVEMLGYSIQNR